MNQCMSLDSAREATNDGCIGGKIRVETNDGGTYHE